MAEQIPYGVATSFIYRLGALAFNEFGRINGVTDELERLKNTVESIKAVLFDADQRQEHDHAVRLWIARLKDVLFEADDLFDEIATRDLLLKVDGHNKIVKQVRCFFSSSNPIVFRRQNAQKLDKIRQKFNDVVEDMSKLNLIARPAVDNQIESGWRETSSFVLESDVVGREDSKREILNQLMDPHDENQNVSIIAIVGIGGLGKTTIAQMVYNDLEVQSLFEKRMWVCVSDDFDVKTIIRKILESLTGGKSDGQESLDNVQNSLREHLNGKRYLLVMDDIWNESHEKWSQFRTYLMCGAQGSKILVTTRSKTVAQTMGVSTPFALKGLTPEQSWSLLKKVAFGNDANRVNDALEPIGKEVAKKCRGVPLAIRTVGGILLGKSSDREWINVLEGDCWKQCEDKNSIMPVLKLSYRNLLPQLRQCFAYCSIYPKDLEIEKNELIQLWMAQGYLECYRQHMEDVGNQFVETLMMKSFFQDAKTDDHGNICSFKMHDLMHDLAILVAGNDCYLDSEQQELVGRPMHMSLDSNTTSLLDSSDATILRTLFIRRSFYSRGDVQSMRVLNVVSTLQCVRVLNLSGSYFLQKLPDSISELKHLRYLDLSGCNLKALPKSMSNLVNLQTLKLAGCHRLQFPTKLITKLINLRHLDISGCKAFAKMMPIGLGKLSQLQSLSSFVAGDDQEKKAGRLNELKDLNSLRGSLHINRLSCVRDVMAQSQGVNLKDKKLLHSLHLDWGFSKSYQNHNDSLQLLEYLCPHQNLKRLEVWQYPGMRFPAWLSLLTNISYISLIDCDQCQYLPPLESLPLLKSLKLIGMKALEYICFGGDTVTFFPSLERLSFNSCDKLRGWQRMGDVAMPPFPRLCELTIHGCPNLISMPTFPGLDKELSLSYSSVKPLTETLRGVSPSSFTSLSMLKSLNICGPISVLDLESFPIQWMRNLTSLQHLSIAVVDGFEVWFKESFNFLPSLQELELYHCKIRAFPESMCNFPSLQHITIQACGDLECLPEWMHHLSKLQTLEIIQCPSLFERYKEKTGVDWHKIAHTPNITLLASTPMRRII